MSNRDEIDSAAATRILVDVVERHGNMTPALAVALARQLAHIAGGDGRGVYYVKHNPTGDQIPPPWDRSVYSHGVLIDVDGASVLLYACQDYGEEATPLVFDEAMDVAEILDRAIARATHNAVEGH